MQGAQKISYVGRMSLADTSRDTSFDIGKPISVIGPRGKTWVGSYRHAMPWPRASVYRAVRCHLGLSIEKMCRHSGLSYGQWRYRESVKRMYHLAELLWLHEVSGMTWEEYGKLLNDCA